MRGSPVPAAAQAPPLVGSPFPVAGGPAQRPSSLSPGCRRQVCEPELLLVRGPSAHRSGGAAEK